MAIRKLKLDPDELAWAFEDHSGEMSWYLDSETGQVLCVTPDTSWMLEQLLAGEADPAVSDRDEFLRQLEDYDCQEWEKEALREAYEIACDTRGRFLPVPDDDSYGAYRDMVEFADGTEDRRLQELLAAALNGRGAFRRFKDALLDFPEERERWFKFRHERLKERMLDWLNSEAIEAVWESKAQGGEMMAGEMDHGKKLPFPTRPLILHGGTVEQYLIPDEMKQEVLNQLYPFAEPAPALDEERYDLHEGKLFKVRDYIVVWENGHNFLVSPYYASSGGSVIDWLPADFADSE